MFYCRYLQVDHDLDHIQVDPDLDHLQVDHDLDHLDQNPVAMRCCAAGSVHGTNNSTRETSATTVDHSDFFAARTRQHQLDHGRMK